MMGFKRTIKLLITSFIIVNFCACKQEPSSNAPAVKVDSLLVQNKNEILPAWNDNISSNDEGVLGIYEVPEMLSLCKLDSAEMKNVSSKIITDFSLLEKDLEDIGAQMDNSQGIIYYNNTPKNFKFECFLVIRSIPAKKPKHSQVVVLESGKMLVYNYHGPYENTYKAYEEIKKYCAKNKLVQIGQLREFYPISQSDEKDPEKFLTRIMVPVAKEKKKK